MRIVVDIRDLQIAHTGTKTYLEELCRVFPLVAPDHEFLFISPIWQLSNKTTTFYKVLRHIGFYWWKEIELPWIAWRKRCQIIFCTDYVVPLVAHCPTIPVFHGANFWEIPQNYNRLWRFLLDIFALPAARKSPAIITVSEYSRQRIAKTTHIPEDKIITVYEAPKQITTVMISTEESKRILDSYDISLDTPYILHVGVRDKRKNLPRLIKAFSKSLPIIGDKYRLILVGGGASSKEMDDTDNIRNVIQDYQLNDYVLLTGHVPDHQLPAFYQSASFYAFPSLYEGFGLPVLEALTNSLPLIASNATSIPEIAGNAAILFNPLDVDDIARAIVMIATEDVLRKELIIKGLEEATKYSWETSAKKIVKIFEKVIREKDMSD